MTAAATISNRDIALLTSTATNVSPPAVASSVADTHGTRILNANPQSGTSSGCLERIVGHPSHDLAANRLAGQRYDA